MGLEKLLGPGFQLFSRVVKKRGQNFGVETGNEATYIQPQPHHIIGCEMSDISAQPIS